MLTQLVISVTLAVVISALCSVSEAALYSIPQSQVEILGRSGRFTGRLLARLRRDVARPITAILTLNTVANTMGAAVAGAAAGALWGNDRLPLFSLAFTLVILLFSEIIPKTVGVTYSRTLAPLLAVPLHYLVFLMAPVIVVCQAVTRLFHRGGTTGLVSAEEIIAVASLGRRSGLIDLQQERIIKNIIDLKDKMVREAMTPRTVVATLEQHLSVDDAMAARHHWERHSRIPLYDRDPDDICGLVLARDILLQAADDNKTHPLADLAKPIHFVPETASLYNVLMEFFERHQHLVAVVDEYGAFTGVLTLEDVVEEIVGREIIDESDTTVDMRALARRRRQARDLDGG